MSRGRIAVVVPPGTIANAMRVIRAKSPTQMQSCARGEHLYQTGRRTCPLCGADL